MLIKLDPERVEYKDAPKEINEMPVALPSAIKDCRSSVDFESIAYKYNFNFLEIKQKNLIFLRKENKTYEDMDFFGFNEIRFVFDNYKLVDIIGKVKAKEKGVGRNFSTTHYFFFKNYLDNRREQISLISNNNNLHPIINASLLEIKGLRFSKYYLFSLLDDLDALLTKSIDVEKIISLNSVIFEKVTFNLNIDEASGIDVLTLSNKRMSSEYRERNRNVMNLILKRRENNWNFHKIEINKFKDLTSSYTFNKDIYACHNDINMNLFPIPTINDEVDDGSSLMVFKEELVPKMKKMKLPKVFARYGFNRNINLRKDIDSQFFFKNKKNKSEIITSVFIYLKHKEHSILDEVNFKNLKDKDAYDLLNFNLPEGETQKIEEKFLLLKELYEIYKDCIKEEKELQEISGFDLNRFTKNLGEKTGLKVKELS